MTPLDTQTFETLLANCADEPFAIRALFSPTACC